jgi:cytochrome c-type biogenesis protein CcmE
MGITKLKKTRFIITLCICILAGIAGYRGSKLFIDNTIEYGDLQTARATNKKIQVKGEWVQDKESFYDHQKGQFNFFMKDEKGEEVKVILDGAKPNNFEVAVSIVVKGKYQDGYFHATEVLTKCPSKYQGTSETAKKTL